MQTIYRFLIELTNGRFTSGLLRKFSQSTASKFIVSSFAKTYRLNVSEMEKSLNDFPTLHDLFVRRLKKDVRPVDQGSNTSINVV